jgi:hypothetical protein
MSRKAGHVSFGRTLTAAGRFAVLATFTAVLAGCGSHGVPDAEQATAPARTTAAAAAPHVAPAGTPSAAPKRSTAAVKPSKIRVPDGVGLNYQKAQDAWRAAGLHVAPATDATGAHRLAMIDANWVVVSQDLPAGAKVNRGTFITATIKKYSD